MPDPRPHRRPRRASLVLWLVGLALLWPAAGDARPSPPPARLTPALHGYDRGLGHRHLHRPTRTERRRFDYGRKQDVRVDVAATNRELEQLARAHGDRMRLTRIGAVGGQPIYRVDLASSARNGGKKRGRRSMRVLVTGGVHGNEPTGTRTAMSLIRRALGDKGMQARYDLTVVPMLNPAGLAALTRENHLGQDLNRTCRPGKWAVESRALRDSVKGERYDLAVDLHGSWRKGHFLLRGTDDGKVSRRILSAMSTQGLLDVPRDATSNEVGPYKVHCLGGASSNTGGTFKGLMAGLGTPYSYTLEYPRTLSPAKQERQMMRLLRSTLDNVYRYGRYDAARPGGRLGATRGP